MKIAIENKNVAKLTDILSDIQGKATARLVSVFDLIDFAADAEKHLESLGVPKDARAGCVFTWCEGVDSNSYKYTTESTRVELTRGSGGKKKRPLQFCSVGLR